MACQFTYSAMPPPMISATAGATPEEDGDLAHHALGLVRREHVADDGA